MATDQLKRVIETLRRATVAPDETGLTDGELLERYLRSREEAAFAALLRRHGPMVWGVCRRVLRSHHDAEDAFQATFLVLVRKAASVVPKEKVAHWLYGVARQTALYARATAAKRKAREKQVSIMPEPALEQHEPWDDLLPLLDQELGHLPEKYRAVIVLCDLEGKTRQETARHLHVPAGTVASRLATARAMLAKRVARHGLALSGGSLAVMLWQNGAPAGVPTSVMASTIKAASLFAARQAAVPGVLSAKAVALAEGVLKTMLLTKLKLATAVLVTVAVLGAGAATVTQQVLADKPADQPETGDVASGFTEVTVAESGTGKPEKDKGMAESRAGPEARPIEQLIADLNSPDGAARVAATTEIFRRGQDTLPDLQRAGAQQLARTAKARSPQRLDMVYSLLEGLPPSPPTARSGYRTDRLRIYMDKECTKEEVVEWGKRFGFTCSDICYSTQPPHCGALLIEGKSLAEVLQALLSCEPKVITVNLGYWD
jgi:RNA polymerase sigma factor (sigma-70 family)